MNCFVNDYNDLCHPEVLENLLKRQEEVNIGYGYDDIVAQARKKINDILEHDATIYFVPTGTGVNMLGTTYNLKPHEAIISANTGHIVDDEVGAIEAKGHKVLLMDQEDGKINAEDLAKKIDSYGDFHNVLPGMVYISNVTEMGTVYRLEEIRAIYDVCKKKGVLLYLDGARLGVALQSSDIKWTDLKDICDIFTIGGTKNGALFGEAIVFNDRKLGDKFNFYMKQQGALLSKGFLLGTQYEALFTEGLYDRIAKASYESAQKLVKSLEGTNVKYAATPESNLLFFYMDNKTIEAMQENFLFEIMFPGEGESIVRFVTTYRTTDEEIENLAAALKEYYN